MRRSLLIVGLLLLAATFALAQNASTGSAKPATVASFDLTAIDKSIDPCTDFYQYACGTWMKNNPIPPDQSSWGRFNELRERNQTILRGILEKQSAENPARNAIDQKIGDYYFSCMDKAAIEAKGTAPVKPYIDRIDAMKEKAELPAVLAGLHRGGVNAFFEFGSEPDFKDSKVNIAAAGQGGLSLPDRDYYFKTDAKSVELREKLEKHIARTFELYGEPPAKAAADAETVMKVETDLAKVSLDRTEQRDPTKIYHKMSTADLQRLTPDFAWNQYITTIQPPSFDSLNVAVPDFVKGMNQVIAANDLDTVKTYLRWHTLRGASPVLPKAFVEEDFDFYGKTLRGAKELRPRWKRCVQYTDSDLGEALGQAYVAEAFPPEAKARTLKMVHELEAALKQDITELSWMTPDTKKQALEKLSRIDDKIGYPDKWRDYSSLQIVRGDAMGNSVRANQFEFNRQLKKIGKPVDRSEWGMTPPTVNAYYNPLENNINFPAGILQPPFYDQQADDAVNFGGIGMVIGHELTHGFDDEGSQFDADGNLKNWWTPKDKEEFNKLEQCFVDEYDSFVAVDDVHLKGKLTLGENTADNGGLRISHMALLDVLGTTPTKEIDGYTPEQRFFISFGQIWCQNQTPQTARLQALSNEHSTGKYRVNGTVSNMSAFAKAFGCKPNAPMIRKPACRVW
ncbi:MAG TPA: M13 family metallopeptidase [Candidatus Eisenbacteria bacterium]|nr:M13 family metallopeptidase [Candidatus Eisenbacteria bacterium]